MTWYKQFCAMQYCFDSIPFFSFLNHTTILSMITTRSKNTKQCDCNDILTENSTSSTIWNWIRFDSNYHYFTKYLTIRSSLNNGWICTQENTFQDVHAFLCTDVDRVNSQNSLYLHKTHGKNPNFSQISSNTNWSEENMWWAWMYNNKW